MSSACSTRLWLTHELLACLQPLKPKHAERFRNETFTTYHQQWATVLAESKPLQIHEVPWPTFLAASNLERLSLSELIRLVTSRSLICSFLLAGCTRANVKVRIRTEILRYHPDKFSQIEARLGDAGQLAAASAMAVEITKILTSLNPLVTEKQWRQLGL